MSKLPRSRRDKIVVQQLDDEVLVYDLKIHKAYCLNKTAAIVFNACDGQTTFDELKREYKFTDDLIYLALDELKSQRLIADDYRSTLAGISRREAIRKVGLASVVALPIVTGLVAPRAADAQSVACVVSGQPCIPGGAEVFPGVTQGNCCSGCVCNPAGNLCAGSC